MGGQMMPKVALNSTKRKLARQTNGISAPEYVNTVWLVAGLHEDIEVHWKQTTFKLLNVICFKF